MDIGLREPTATFFGDLDPKTRVLQGEITVVAPAYAMGLQGFRLYPTNDGENHLNLIWSDTQGPNTDNAQHALPLKKSCPPDANNEDQLSPVADWLALAQEPCGNDNPYSPKCLGKSCPYVNVLPGSQGEFYISRFDSQGNAATAPTVNNWSTIPWIVPLGDVNWELAQDFGSNYVDPGALCYWNNPATGAVETISNQVEVKRM